MAATVTWQQASRFFHQIMAGVEQIHRSLDLRWPSVVYQGELVHSCSLLGVSELTWELVHDFCSIVEDERGSPGLEAGESLIRWAEEHQNRGLWLEQHLPGKKIDRTNTSNGKPLPWNRSHLGAPLPIFSVFPLKCRKLQYWHETQERQYRCLELDSNNSSRIQSQKGKLQGGKHSGKLGGSPHNEDQYTRITQCQDGQLLKTACGSPCYAAPEMVAGQRYVVALVFVLTVSMRPSLGHGKCTLLDIEQGWVKSELVASNLPRFVCFCFYWRSLQLRKSSCFTFFPMISVWQSDIISYVFGLSRVTVQSEETACASGAFKVWCLELRGDPVCVGLWGSQTKGAEDQWYHWCEVRVVESLGQFQLPDFCWLSKSQCNDSFLGHIWACLWAPACLFAEAGIFPLRIKIHLLCIAKSWMRTTRQALPYSGPISAWN